MVFWWGVELSKIWTSLVYATMRSASSRDIRMSLTSIMYWFIEEFPKVRYALLGAGLLVRKEGKQLTCTQLKMIHQVVG
jgi:hypothetical protein